MRRIFLVLGFVLAAIHATAYQHLNFQDLNMTRGISDNYVRSISQDSWGMMWFVTLNGIDNYDGYSSHHYNINNDPYWGDALYKVFEAGDSILWVTGAKDIYCYDRQTDSFSNDIMPVLKRYGINVRPEKLFVDKDHCLWLLKGSTLWYYDMSRKRLSRINLPKGYLLHDLACRNGKAYVLMDAKKGVNGSKSSNSPKVASVWRVNIQQGKVYWLTDTGYPLRTFSNIYIDTTGRLWFYNTHETHLKWLNEATREWIEIPELSPSMGIMVTFVMDDGDGNLWIGTDNRGVFVYDYEQQSTTQLQQGVNDAFSLVDDHIVCFYKDEKSGTMWVGTSKQGAVFASLNQMNVDLIPMRLYGGTHAADVSVIYESAALQGGKGTLLLGFDGQGIGTAPLSDIGNIDHYTTANSRIPSNQIMCTLTDSKGRQWWGSYGGELFYRKGGEFNVIHNDLLNYVCAIKEDRLGNVWFGTWEHGVISMDASGKFVNYTMGNSTLRTDNITDLEYDGHNTMYIATSNGLFAADIVTGNISRIIPNHVKVLYFDRRQKLLWIGMRSGLMIRDTKNGRNTKLTTANGLSHNYVLGIAQDHNGNIWVSTRNGVSVVTRDHRCTPFYSFDGLGNTTFNMHAIACASNGDILVGGIGYVVSITPRKSYNMNLAQYPVRFTGLSINGEPIEVGKEDSEGDVILNQNILYKSSLTLHTSDRNVSFAVSSMNYANLHKLRYMYRLHDNEKWILAESNVITLNALSAGRYALQVKVAEPDGQNNNPVSTMYLDVLAPWYASGLAFFLYCLIAFGIVTLYFYRLQKQHQKEQEAEKERLQIKHEQDINNAKMRFFTNVSHDLRTPLSLIITPLERMLKHSDIPEEIRRQLELMQRSAQTLMNDVTQLLDFRKLDESLEVLNPKNISLRDLTEHECLKIDDSNLPNGIHLEIKLSDDPLFASVDEKKMKRILNNLLSNAIKYNSPDGTITVETFLEPSGTQSSEPSGTTASWAVLRVSDTGIGISKDDREKIFDRFYQGKHDETTYIGSGIGLYIIKQYVTLHGGTISVNDNKPQGSVFEVRIPTSSAPSQVTTPREGMREATILVVEDNDDFRSFLVNCLCEKYSVLEASNGKEALDILKKSNTERMLILSDVMMPVMDGMELLKCVKTDVELSHIPFILLTARTAEEYQLTGLKDGADDYITKPFNLDILLLRIQRLLKWTAGASERFRKMDVKPSEITVSSVDEELITRAIAIVEKNMGNQEYSVDDLCDEMAMSRSGFYKKLTAITGLSPIMFIRTLRIKRGRELLDKAAGSISQIAYKVGLSPKQFAKYFKEEYGVSPSELAKR